MATPAIAPRFLRHLRGGDSRCATHPDEAIALHDSARDPGVDSREEFSARVRDNARNRCLRHHVIDLELLATVLADSGWRALAAERARPMHMVAWARKEVA